MFSEGIQFKTNVAGLDRAAPIKPAAAYFPQWFKDMDEYFEKPAGHQFKPNNRNMFGKVGDIAKNFYTSTVKRCPAVIDYLSSGYIIPYWTDTLIQRNDDYLEVDSKDFPISVSSYDADQVYKMPISETDYKHPLKFASAWYFYTPKGWSTLFIAPYYQFEKRFTVLPAVVETDKWHEVNFPTIIHDKEFMIKQGTPFIQAIPFKRSKFKFSMSMLTDDDKYHLDSNTTFLNSNFKGGYRKATKSNG